MVGQIEPRDEVFRGTTDPDAMAEGLWHRRRQSRNEGRVVIEIETGIARTSLTDLGMTKFGYGRVAGRQPLRHNLTIMPGHRLAFPSAAETLLDPLAGVADLLHRLLDAGGRAAGFLGFVADFELLSAGYSRPVLLASSRGLLGRRDHSTPL